LKIDLPYTAETPLKFDIRTRNKIYISPEQIKIGIELQGLSEMHNGRIDQSSAEV